MKTPVPSDHRPIWLRLLFLSLIAPVLAWGPVLSACTPLSTVPTDGAGSGVMMLTRENSESTITIRQGEIILIKLERAGSTGYEWRLDDGYGKHFELLSRKERQQTTEEARLGGPVVTTWLLQAEAPGEIALELHLYRQWEGRGKSTDWFAISVTIE